MKAKTFVSCCRLLFIVLCVQLSTCQVFRTPRPFPDTAERSTVSATNQCDDSCSGSFNETLCKMYGACTLQCPSSSRNSFPSYGSSALKTICTGNKKQPTNPPGAADATNGNLFYNSSTGNCVANETGDLTRSALSVWVTGSCNNCSFLRIGEPGFLSLSLSDQSDLIINDKIYGKANGWTHLLIQKSPNNSLSVSMNGELKTTISYGGLSKKIQIGVSTSVSSGSVHILDFRLYQKLLTDREVKKLYNNIWDGNYDVPDCRCPVSHPALDSSGYICYGDANSQQPRLEKALRNTSAITDGSSNTSWVSGNTGVTTLTIELGNSFQISSIQLLFLGTLPYNASWMYYLNNGNIDMSQFTCNKTGCQLNGNVNDYETYLKTVADKIEVNLHSSENLIISQLIVHGSCNCNGNADNCTQNSSSNDYTCDCIAAHNKEGKHCEDCKNMYYRLTDEFVCNRSCPNCNTDGRNPNRHCMQIGGNCSCKANVEGTLCDMCKHLTYKLGPSTEGCTQSNCSSDGSESCNNETGSCNCYPNVTGNTCDRCSPLHYNITSGRGCESCLCSSKGRVKKNLQCNVTSGKCDCKTNVTGRQCDECKDDYWNLESTNDVGCTKCVCNMIGSTNSTCNKQTGQCPCWNNDDSNTECNPTSTSVIPKFGPQVGGTLVTVSGHLLNGSSMYFPKIYLDGNNTSIISKSETRIIFKTSKMDVSKELDVELRWHQQSYLIKLGKFSYRPDPAITLDTIPAVTTFGSGGCRVTMKGTNLDSVYQPKVKVSTGSEVHEAVCEVENSGVMKCPTPRLNTSSPNSSFSLDLELDGVKYTNVTQVTVVHDPQLKDAKIVDFKYPFEKTVTLHGARLQAACHAEDVTVMIGKGQCRNIKLSDTTITCEPPADAPGNGNEFTIHVSIGFFNQSVGKLYYKPWWETRYFVFIVVGIAAFLILVFAILIAICCCVCRKRRRRNRNLNNENEESAKFTDVALDPGAELLPVSEPSSASRGSDSTFAIDNPAYTMEPAAVDTDMVIITESFLHQLEESIRGNVGECLINGDQFEIGNICSHKGTISRVVNGNFTFSAEKNPNVKLTIKMPIKAVADTAKLPTWTSSVLREALRLRKHVSGSTHRIYGIGLDNKYFYLLYPYMENRTLKDHIVKSSNNFQLCQLVRFCVDVAEGMDFLASKDIVHKDLAARNCWVDSNQTVMVGDGSFSYDLFPKEYIFDKLKDRHIPVRWMAPESLQSGFYDTKSDVWSFGIVMWEVLTRGLLPFQEIPDDQVKNYVVKGYRLGKPHLVCDDLFMLLNMCWDSETEDRPSFSALATRFHSMLAAQNAHSDDHDDDVYINTPSRPDSIYVNLADAGLKKLPPRSKKQENIYGNV